ncbi:hypothetical protein, conserved [Eimeria brunetti]|uniref:C2H2-type domain-containing protein n=1 Tax=Eimeria brunetti TaxID=51314 RepID=U6LL95_9EIME|nr:hypothetical protein, conserved [Eimeria brunetti]
MAKTLATGGDGTPIFEALQSGTTTVLPAPIRTQVQPLQQYHAIQEGRHDQQRLSTVQAGGKVAVDAGSEGGLRNSFTEDGAIVVGMLVQCGECGKKFINSYYLEKHINKRHRGDLRQSTVTRLENPHISTLGTSAFHQAFDSVRTAISAPLTILEQQQQQQITQQQQLLQQQQTLQQQQHLLQQQLSLLSAAALRASDIPKAANEFHQRAPMTASAGGMLLEEAGGTLCPAPGRNSSTSPIGDNREQAMAEVKNDVQREIQKAVKPPQHRDTAAVLLDELRDGPAKESDEENRRGSFTHDRPQDSSGSRGTCRSTSSTSTERYSAKDGSSEVAKQGTKRGGDSYYLQRSKGGYRRGCGRGEAEGGRGGSKTAKKNTRRKPTKGIDQHDQTKNASRQPCVPYSDEENTFKSRYPQYSYELPTGGMPQPAAATGPEAAKEMRRAILCLLMYSHRQAHKLQRKWPSIARVKTEALFFLCAGQEFMARSQLPDVLRHNNKPPPDEVEKQLELPPGTLSCQLANYLLHPAVPGQRSGVTTSNAPQNSDSLNLPWPAPHGVGGCCYHLHKPPPPPRTFSVRAKLQQLIQRLGNKPPTSIGCPEAQQQNVGANGPLQTPRQRWTPPSASAPPKLATRDLGRNPPIRLNGAQLVMQHGGQGGSVALPSLGAQKQPQQILPYTIDGGAAQSPAGAHPLTMNTPRVLPGAHVGPAHRSEPLGVAQLENNKNGLERQHSPEQSIGAREKSKSITEREVGTVLPALAWGGEEAIPSEEDLALPEPKSPFYPARNPTDGNKVAPIFPPCSSWTPIEPPPTATSVPLSVLHAALAANGMTLPPHTGSAAPTSGRQTTSQVPQQQTNNQLPPEKHQLPQPVFTQHLGPPSFGGDFAGSRLQAASTNEELSGVQLRAPDSAFGVFGGPATAAAAQGQGGPPGNTEYLPSARGSRTLPEDAGWTTTTYQAQNDLGPWQFAGLT